MSTLSSSDLARMSSTVAGCEISAGTNAPAAEGGPTKSAYGKEFQSPAALSESERVKAGVARFILETDVYADFVTKPKAEDYHMEERGTDPTKKCKLASPFIQNYKKKTERMKENPFDTNLPPIYQLPETEIVIPYNPETNCFTVEFPDTPAANAAWEVLSVTMVKAVADNTAAMSQWLIGRKIKSGEDQVAKRAVVIDEFIDTKNEANNKQVRWMKVELSNNSKMKIIFAKVMKKIPIATPEGEPQRYKTLTVPPTELLTGARVILSFTPGCMVPTKEGITLQKFCESVQITAEPDLEKLRAKRENNNKRVCPVDDEAEARWMKKRE